MIIHISFRHELIKRAESPNKYPWNVSDHSKQEDTGNPEQMSSTPSQQMVSLKMDKERLELDSKSQKNLPWEALNQLGQEPTPSDNANMNQKGETKY